MAGKARTALKWLGRLLLIHLAVSFLCSIIVYFRPGPNFIGSPPSKYAPHQRNNMNFSDHGAWWGKYGKLFRPSGYLDITAAGAFSPIVHHFAGWDVYRDDLCIEGVIEYSPGISDDDGDVGFALTLPPPYEEYGFRPGHPMDHSSPRHLVVEVDEPIRKNFPVVYDLARGDCVRVCGRWVYDRGHDHNEIHPARWIEILKESNELIRSPP